MDELDFCMRWLKSNVPLVIGILNPYYSEREKCQALVYKWANTINYLLKQGEQIREHTGSS